jgi:phosphatidylglycerophosphate synthase
LKARMDIHENIFSEYKKNSKEFFLEEPFDFIIFRPIAFLILKIVYFSSIRPDHFSLMALIVAIFSGYQLSTGSADGFTFAGIGILIFCVLDCCDGMLARMKKNGSEYGQLIDMFVDLLSSISFYTGLFIGLFNNENLFPFHYLAIVSAVFILIHASIYNYYKSQLIFHLENNPNGRNKEIEGYRKNLEELQKSRGRYFHKLLISLFLIFSRAQKNPENKVKTKIDKYIKYNKPILPMWGISSGSSHLMLFAISLITHRVGLYFFFSIVLANLWLIFVSVIQSGVNSSIENSR